MFEERNDPLKKIISKFPSPFESAFYNEKFMFLIIPYKELQKEEQQELFKLLSPLVIKIARIGEGLWCQVST